MCLNLTDQSVYSISTPRVTNLKTGELILMSSFASDVDLTETFNKVFPLYKINHQFNVLFHHCNYGTYIIIHIIYQTLTSSNSIIQLFMRFYLFDAFTIKYAEANKPREEIS